MIRIKNNKLEIVIVSTIAANYKVVLFNAYQPQTENRYQDASFNNQAGFINNMIPQLTLDGMSVFAQNVPAFSYKNLVYWDSNGNMRAIDNALLQSWVIGVADLQFPYRSLLQWLQTNNLNVSKIRIACSDPTQLSQQWNIVKRYPGGSAESQPIINTNIISPMQVQSGIAEFSFNEVIDAYTAIEIPLVPNASVNIKFYLKNEI